jgi:nitrite reductase/ring-hydroxylating ferredoxin subunit
MRYCPDDACAARERLRRRARADARTPTDDGADMPQSYLVCRADELNDGDRRVVSCDGVEVGVFKIDGRFVAWHNECPHRQGPVCQGRIYRRVREPIAHDGTVRALAYDDGVTNIVCSWHGYEFDLKTGINQGSDRFRLRAAKLDEKDGNIYVVV